MKIERINENQIRCTLTQEDLSNREIKLSELAYGSDKAKLLFRDMMQQAAYEFGFEADDIPLMVEAVPINAECIVLTITKVEDPEELDTRFAKFAPSVHGDDDEDDDMDPLFDESDSDMFKMMASSRDHEPSTLSAGRGKEPLEAAEAASAKESEKEFTHLTRLFSFSSLDEVTSIAAILTGSYNGANSLYKNPSTGEYLLLACQSGMPLPAFGKVCNILSEYGQTEKNLSATAAYLDEHLDPLIKDCALQKLALMAPPKKKSIE